MRADTSGDLVVLSHLRWTFVWQRPQHIVSRLARDRRTWFVEEPWPSAAVDRPRLCQEEHGDVTRVWLEVPASAAERRAREPGPASFDDERAGCYAEELADLLGPSADRLVWLYTPVALPLVGALQPSTLAYDVMDDLASFAWAPDALKLLHRQALRSADVVFAGGRSLHRGVAQHRPEGTHLFPSGVESEHFAAAQSLRRPRPRPVAGYVGVIDERLDLDLVADLAAALPDWEIHMVGPVVKIDPASLPEAPNLAYHGPKAYAHLPAVLAGFDVALMPFALNAATRSISPTKTLEYLAAGLPVVSTRVPDVVADHSAVVELADDGAGFADACRRVGRGQPGNRLRAAETLLRVQHWDSIVQRMSALVETAGQAREDSA